MKRQKIDETLYAKAEELAARNYAVEVESDTLSNGEPVYLANHPELRGCKAQGATVHEAIKELLSATTDYIYFLLVDKRRVPEPNEHLTLTASNTIATIFMGFTGNQFNYMNTVYPAPERLD